MIADGVTDEGLKEAFFEADRQNRTKLELEDYARASIKKRNDVGRLEKAVRVAVTEAVKKAEEAIAKSLKSAGVDPEIIARTTGLQKRKSKACDSFTSRQRAYNFEYTIGRKNTIVFFETLCWYSGFADIVFHSGLLPNVFQCSSLAALLSNDVMYIRLGMLPPTITCP